MKSDVVIVALMGALFLGVVSVSFKKEITKYQEDVELSYGADNIFVKHQCNSGIVGDYDSFKLKDDTRYLILPKNTPDIVNLTIVEEEHWTTHIVPVSISKIKTINKMPIKILRTDLPVLHITTDVDEWSVFDSEKTLKDSDGLSGNVAFEYKPSTMLDMDAKITRHGNSSWSMSLKRGYNIKFDKKVSMFGMPKSKSWNLLGVGLDKTLSRDYASRVFANKIDYPFVTQMQYVTLYVNGRYKGVFQLTEKPKKIMERRMNVNNGDFAVVWMDVDKEFPITVDFKNNEFDEEASYMNGQDKWSVNIVLPDKEESRFSDEYYKEKVQELIDSLEQGSIDKIDLNSWVKYYWIQEFSMNYDAWYRSAYSFYKADEDKWYQGTAWDFDRSWQYCDNRLCTEFDTYDSTIGNYGLYVDLFQNEEFTNAVYDCFNETIRQAMIDTRNDLIKHKESIRHDGDLNYMFWKEDRGCVTTFMDFLYSTSYDNAYDNFMDYYKKREDFLNDNYDKLLKELTNGKFSK